MNIIKKLGKRSVVLGFLAIASTSWAQVNESLGVSCEVRVNGQSVSQFSEISAGPWVHVARTIRNESNTYLLRVEATEGHNGWGVIRLKNVETEEASASYGPVTTHNVFRLDYRGISILCSHWPYIAG